MRIIKQLSISVVGTTLLCVAIVLLYSACDYVGLTTFSYVCANGTAASDATEATDGTTKCSSCNYGYVLSDNTCFEQSSLPTEFFSTSFTDTATEMEEIVTTAPIDQLRTIQLTIDPGQTPISSLFFQFTNTNQSISTTPQVRISAGADNIVDADDRNIIRADVNALQPHVASGTDDGLAPNPIHLPATPLPLPSTAVTPSTTSNSNTSPISALVNTISASSTALGDGRAIRLHQIQKTETLYARAVRTIGEWSVIAWVHPDVYVGCSGDSCLNQPLTQSDVNDIVDVFFKDGAQNDIFDWTTTITGAPWGDHGYDGDEIDEDGDNSQEPNILISGDTRTINLILTDIDNVGYATSAIVGYFYGGDTFLEADNNALMLYLHAPWAKFDTTDDARQDSFYYYFLSALAHEFQHLVHFYQRRLRLDVQDPTWLNEQYSLIIEDILTQNIIGDNTNGLDDRGLNGLSSGIYPVCNGRLPDFVEQSYYGISRWGYSSIDNEPFVNYAVNYSFGNFLLRNYNGVAYLNSSYSHNGGYVASIEAGLGDDTFADAITKWGTAILLSDNPSAPIGYRVNNGDSGFSYTHNGVSYSFGSTNYYNYGTVVGSGNCNALNVNGAFAVFDNTERLYNRLDNEQHGHSNIFYEAGTDVSGLVEFVVTLPIGSRLSVIAKRQENNNNPVYF